MHTENRHSYRSWLNAIICAALLGVASIASAGMHLSLSGSQSSTHAGLQKIESGAGSASVAFDVWDYLRLGYTYRQEIASTGGYTEGKNADGGIPRDADGNALTYVKFLNRSRVISQSLDLTIVLYAGDVFMPYVFVGYGTKQYDILNQTENQPDEHTRSNLPSPNGGAGFGIRLSQRFSLKFSYTVSLGVKQLPGQVAESTLDNYTQVGISYAL